MGGQPANWKIVVDNYLEGYHVPIAHPGLMRLYDYKRYDVECHDGWVWFDAPLRDKPSSNRLERTYQRLAEPMPGLRPRTPASGATSSSTRTRRSTCTRTRSGSGRYDPKGRCDGRPRTDPAAADASRAGARLSTPTARSTRSRNEDVDLVENQQAGLATRGFHPGPLSRREAAVAWFADRIRADLEEAGLSANAEQSERDGARAHPGRGRRA